MLPLVLFLSEFVRYVISLLQAKFLPDLSLALVDGLQTLASEHVDLLGGESRPEQTAQLYLFLVQGLSMTTHQPAVETVVCAIYRAVDALPVNQRGGFGFIDSGELRQQMLVGFSRRTGNRAD